jgi:transcription elongation factor GreB
MSKAFTRESDDDLPELPALRPASASLPAGVPNHLTADGAERLRQDLDVAMNEERPRLQAAVRSGADKESLQKLDQKIRLWEEILESASIVPPSPEEETRTRFGTTVTVRDAVGEEDSYRIVGVDEIDIDRGWISWISPLAKALVNTQVGQKVQVKLPGGNRELTVIQVSQQAPS